MPEFILPGAKQIVGVDEKGVLRIVDIPVTTDDPVLIRFLRAHKAQEKPRPPVRTYHRKGGEE